MSPEQYDHLTRTRPELLLPYVEPGTLRAKLIAKLTPEELVTEIAAQVMDPDDHTGFYWSLFPIWVKHFGKDELAPWSSKDIELT